MWRAGAGWGRLEAPHLTGVGDLTLLSLMPPLTAEPALRSQLSCQNPPVPKVSPSATKTARNRVWRCQAVTLSAGGVGWGGVCMGSAGWGVLQCLALMGDDGRAVLGDFAVSLSSLAALWWNQLLGHLVSGAKIGLYSCILQVPLAAPKAPPEPCMVPQLVFAVKGCWHSACVCCSPGDCSIAGCWGGSTSSPSSESPGEASLKSLTLPADMSESGLQPQGILGRDPGLSQLSQ